jgi:hypothetical protein
MYNSAVVTGWTSEGKNMAPASSLLLLLLLLLLPLISGAKPGGSSSGNEIACEKLRKGRWENIANLKNKEKSAIISKNDFRLV